MSSGASYVSRITQLDALTLDSELEKLLQGPFIAIIRKIQGSNRWTAEAELILSFAIWKFSVFDRCTTVGQRLLGLKYISTKKRLVYLFILNKILPYAQEKLARLKPNLRFVWDAIEKIVKACRLLNLLTFLVQNRYPSLVMRCAGVRMGSISPNAQTSVGYSYQIRELLWHQFSDILAIILPVINLQSVMNYFVKPSQKLMNPLTISDNSNETSTSINCCFCLQDPVIPTKFGNCVFCYYCLTANLKSNSNFQCASHMS